MTSKGRGVRRAAQIDGEYRYTLQREWWERDRNIAKSEPSLLTFVMLNPSTANDQIDDPTIRRCIGFARREGAVVMEVMNLYALRATNPAALLVHPDPVGIGNDALLTQVARQHTRFKTVVAWGAHKMVTPERTAILTDSARAAGTTLWCLGKTKSGAPRHPLYVRGDAPLVPWFDGTYPKAGDGT